LRHFIFLISICLGLQSCQTNDWAVKDTSLDATDQALFASWKKLDEQFDCCANIIWTANFRPQDNPVLFARTKNGIFQYAYVINHPNPSHIPSATRITDPAVANLAPVYRFDQLPTQQFNRIGNFDFEFPLAGHDVFAVSYQKRTAQKIQDALENNNEYQNPGESIFADVASDDWILFLAHEIFHRRQFKQWVQLENNQNLDTYNFSQENIALILLEQQILKNGIRKKSAAAAKLALLEYAAVRNYRQIRYGKQIETLDSAQEIYEGTSRYIEHSLGEMLKNPDFNLSNFAEHIENDEEIFPEINVRDTLGFGRFYASGAAVSALLDRAGVDWKGHVKTASSFSEIITQHYQDKDPLRRLNNARIRHNYPAQYQRAKRYVQLLKL